MGKKKHISLQEKINAVKFQEQMFIYWWNVRKQNPFEIPGVPGERHSGLVTVTALRKLSCGGLAGSAVNNTHVVTKALFAHFQIVK